MTNRFASGQKAIGICDVCGFQYPLRKLHTTFVKGRKTNVLSCPTCWDPDHPQLRLGEFPVDDPQALRNPRPDTAELASSRDFQYGWNPVGLNDPLGLTPNNLVSTGFVGQVTVITS